MLIKQMLFTMHLQNYLGFRKKEKKLSFQFQNRLMFSDVAFQLQKTEMKNTKREREMNSAVF